MESSLPVAERPRRPEWMKVRAPSADSRAVTGRITGTDAHGVRLDVAGKSREFGYSELGPGRIQIEFAPLDADEDRLEEGGQELGGRADNRADLGADEEGPDGH